jgi:plasmid stabilization system protein ParE
MSSYRLLRRARTDLLDIARYTAERWDEQQARGTSPTCSPPFNN